MAKWTLDDIGDQTGRYAVVTGANSGTGYHVALELARRGATVVLACRNADRAEAAAARIRAEVGAGRAADLETAILDLADLDSVAAFADAVLAKRDRIDLLVNNAGVMAVLERRTTAQGHELQFGTNHLGHFALSGRLLPALRDTAGARVVTVSSTAHRSARSIDFDDLESERKYSAMGTYGLSKVANLLFAFELDRRLRAAGAALASVAAHPGYASTNLVVAGPALGGRTSPFWRLARPATKVLAQSAASGALPLLYAATSPDVHGGDYAGPRVFEQWGAPRKVGSTKVAADPANAARLWAASVALTGVAFDGL